MKLRRCAECLANHNALHMKLDPRLDDAMRCLAVRVRRLQRLAASAVFTAFAPASTSLTLVNCGQPKNVLDGV